MRKLVLLAAVCALALTSGCVYQGQPRPPRDRYGNALRAGDAALTTGHVYGAWQWYRAALAAQEPEARSTALITSEDRTERLFRARQELARPGTPERLGSPALVLTRYAVGETETVEARDRALEGLSAVRDALLTEYAQAERLSAEGDIPVAGPWTRMVTRTTGREWDSDLRPVPGRLGERLRNASAALNEAALQLAAAAGSPATARVSLDAAGAALDRASAEMDAAASVPPTLLAPRDDGRYASR